MEKPAPQPPAPAVKIVSESEMDVLRVVKFKLDRAQFTVAEIQLELNRKLTDIAEKYGVDLTRNRVDIETGVVIPQGGAPGGS